jgi:hypothetical protein
MTAFRGLKTSGYVCGEHKKIEKVTGSQDDVFVGVLRKKHPMTAKRQPVRKAGNLCCPRASAANLTSLDGIAYVDCEETA